MGIVYQDHALFPHMNVLQNILYGLMFHAPALTQCGQPDESAGRAAQDFPLAKPVSDTFKRWKKQHEKYF